MNGCGSSRPSPVSVKGTVHVGLIAIVAAGAAAASVTAAPPADPFRPQGRRPVEAVLTAGESWDTSARLETSMAGLVGGVIAHYDRRTIGELLRCPTDRVFGAQEISSAARIAVVHLAVAGRRERARVEILRLADGSVAARPLEAQAGAGVRLDRNAFDKLAARWPAYRGGFDAPAEPSARSFVMDPPYVRGSITMDKPTMRKRLYRGMRVAVQDADRDLARETLNVRLPAGYEPRHPAGLLVWASPTPQGRIPAIFGPALDELTIVCVGADHAGNERDVPGKFQLVFDAIATACRRYHIDDRRIYITGMSGGGKVSSILATCFSEVFRGAIPIVGFGSYARLDGSWGEHRRPYFTRPERELLRLARQNRMALIGGPRDFNYREMLERKRLLEADGFVSIRFFDYPEMAHQMPTPQRFAEALGWIDEPYRLGRAREAAAASALLAAYFEGRDDPTARTDDDRRALDDVIDAGAWSDAAWRALELQRTR